MSNQEAQKPTNLFAAFSELRQSVTPQTVSRVVKVEQYLTSDRQEGAVTKKVISAFKGECVQTGEQLVVRMQPQTPGSTYTTVAQLASPQHLAHCAVGGQVLVKGKRKGGNLVARHFTTLVRNADNQHHFTDGSLPGVNKVLIGQARLYVPKDPAQVASIEVFNEHPHQLKEGSVAKDVMNLVQQAVEQAKEYAGRPILLLRGTARDTTNGNILDRKTQRVPIELGEPMAEAKGWREFSAEEVLAKFKSTTLPFIEKAHNSGLEIDIFSGQSLMVPTKEHIGQDGQVAPSVAQRLSRSIQGALFYPDGEIAAYAPNVFRPMALSVVISTNSDNSRVAFVRQGDSLGGVDPMTALPYRPTRHMDNQPLPNPWADTYTPKPSEIPLHYIVQAHKNPIPSIDPLASLAAPQQQHYQQQAAAPQQNYQQQAAPQQNELAQQYPQQMHQTNSYAQAQGGDDFDLEAFDASDADWERDLADAFGDSVPNLGLE